MKKYVVLITVTLFLLSNVLTVHAATYQLLSEKYKIMAIDAKEWTYSFSIAESSAGVFVPIKGRKISVKYADFIGSGPQTHILVRITSTISPSSKELGYGYLTIGKRTTITAKLPDSSSNMYYFHAYCGQNGDAVLNWYVE